MLRTPDFKPHWKEGLSNDEYHADRGTVSSSGLRRILKSPRSFRAAIDGPPDEPTDAMKFGTLVHQVVLEGPEFLKRYVVAPTEFVGLTKDGRESTSSKEAKEKKAAWYAEQVLAGSIIVTQQEFDDVRGMLDSVVGHPDAFALLKNGVTEVSGYYADPETGILCRIRPDFLSTDLMALVDLKTTTDCSEREFARSIWTWRYDIQIAMYGDGVEQIEGRKIEHHAFIAVEKRKPYECAVYHADQALLEKGLEDYRRGLRILRKCIDSGQWPGYQQRIGTIGLPSWALSDY